ncbi:MAG: hypothetical protein MUE40_13805, partial [Anaerolineae bacterium]|nr:hypothetical protein [Anaerolineae bacterium]
AIALHAADVLTFDFGAPYRKTYEEALYGLEIDYRQLPERFETYSPADQACIRQRLQEIAALPEP